MTYGFFPESILLTLLALATSSALGLVTIWAGLGRPHWFFRIAVVGAVLSLGLIIPAHELVVIFFIQSVVVIVPLLFARHLRARTGGARLIPQYTLLDILLVTVVVAVILTVAVNLSTYAFGRCQVLLSYIFGFGGPSPPAPWVIYGLPGGCFGISTLVAAWVALGGSRLRWRLLVLCVSPWSWPMAAWLALYRAKGYAAGVAVVVLSLAILLLPTVVYYRLLTPPPIPKTTLPEPNGYVELVHAAKQLENVTVPNVDTATPAQLRSFDAKYRKFLETSRLALDRECQVPIEYTLSYLNATVDNIGLIRQLARAYVAQGKSAELDGRTDDAVRSYVDTIRLGRAISRGGLAIDWLVGCMFEGMGVHALYGLRGSLTPEQCRRLIGTLQVFDANRQRLDETWYRDEVCTCHVYGWPAHLLITLQKLRGYENPSWSVLENEQTRLRAIMRILICELALRAYHLQHGALPERLADLVPDVLPAVPEDPFSGRPLVYYRTDKGHRTDKGYELYSTGLAENFPEWGGPPGTAKPDEP
jgi:hypothetical protein